MLKVVHDADASNHNKPAGGSLLDEIVRDGARAMLAAALQAEVAAYIDAHAGEVDEAGHRLVVRNGFHQPREVVTAAGAVPVRAPRVNDKRIDEISGERMRFSSAILPAWARKSPQVAEVLPLLYLHGLSSSDFGPALEQFLGSAAGLSPTTITRLTAQWQDDAEAFTKRSLKNTDYVYVWVDGIHLKIRLEQDKVCLLVMIGVRADGSKELVALADGFRESTESWADLLRSCRRRGMTAPVLAVGNGALGFWKALREVFPATREQRCWFHVSSNVLAALPKSAHPGAKAALAEIYTPRTATTPCRRSKHSRPTTAPSGPRQSRRSPSTRMCCWRSTTTRPNTIHLRTTNPIESTFATVRLRQRITKGPGSRAAGVAMAFKLIESAQTRWRAVNAPHLVALVRAGARFEKGKLVERPDESGGDQQVA
jgi:putative transposase